MKKILLIVLAVIAAVFIFVIAFCNHNVPRSLIAKIRYFDGCTDTLSIRDYRVLDNSILITKTDGRMVLVGSNNVILIEDEEYWEEGSR